MKIQIDTDNKTVKVEGTVNFNELIKAVKKLLPEDWQKYSLESGTIIQWSNPIIIHDYNDWWHHPYRPWYPYYGTTISGTHGAFTLTTTDIPNGTDYTTVNTNNAVYCVEVN